MEWLLPPELVDNIISYLDNESFHICQEASLIFRVSSTMELKRRKYGSKTAEDMAIAGDLEGVKFHRESVTCITTNEAIKNGQLHVTKWLYSIGVPGSSYSVDWAVRFLRTLMCIPVSPFSSCQLAPLRNSSLI